MGFLSKRFSEALESLLTIESGETVVVAVSGGPDSVCLLDLLREKARTDGFHLLVAHLNHGFRQEAGAESRFVVSLAARWGIPATAKKVDIPLVCRGRKVSKQVAAREARYRFLEEAAQTHGARWIALGHTADDQAETVLMHIIRGSAESGLSGIPPVREERFIRPLLSFTRSEIVEHLKERNIPFVEDPSNADPAYLRSRIRHELLPMLTRYNPRIRQTLCREANLIREENQFIDAILKDHLPKLVIQQPEGIGLSTEYMMGLSPVLSRRAVCWAIQKVKGNLEGITSEHISSILRLLSGSVSRRKPLPGGIVVERVYDRLLFCRQTDRRPPPVWDPLRLTVPGEVEVPGISLTIALRKVIGTKAIRYGRMEAAFDFDRLTFPLVLRSRLPGERFYPVGMKGSKKLQDYFVDEKVPRGRRDHIPLLTSPKGILWVIGHRRDRRFVATRRTCQTLLVTVSDLSTDKTRDKTASQRGHYLETP